MSVRRMSGDRLFGLVNGLFLVLVAMVCFLPIWYALNSSILPFKAYLKDPTHLLPLGFTLDSYRDALRDASVWRSFANGLLVMLGTVILALCTTITSAYTLTRKQLPGRRILVCIFLIPMFFGGGLIPTYLVWKQLHLLNSLWGLMLAGCLNGYWMLILKATMDGLPESLEESARIDGAHDFQVVWYIMIPLCKATLACIALMVGVGTWNEFFWAQIVMVDPSKYTFMVYLRQLFTRISILQGTGAASAVGGVPTATITFQMAIVCIGVMPIVIIYPLVQRYFVKGIMMGAIKA